jgi:hypothetical protein
LVLTSVIIISVFLTSSWSTLALNWAFSYNYNKCYQI